jgi:glycogen(starch) synthase
LRILFLSNFFPPARSGGYTQWCQEVAEGLVGRGHTIGVLTSRYEMGKAAAGEQHIYRLLHLEGDLAYYQPGHFFTQWKQQQRENRAFVQQVIQSFAPDLVFIWGMWAISKAVPALVEQLMPGRVVYYLSDYWPAAADMHTAYWQLPAERPLMRPVKWLLGQVARYRLAQEGQPALKLAQVICVSGRVRELLVAAGLPVQNARIIYGGSDVERFLNGQRREASAGHLKLLYAGQLVQHKGVHTAIEAMTELVKRRGLEQFSLTIVGAGHPDYEAFLHELVEREGLGYKVTIRKAVSKEEIPALFQQFDVLIFPSIYEEPFARITQEAMASGLAVVGTTTGGTKEILREGETGLTFVPEDAKGLADQVARLLHDPVLRGRLAQNGRQMVLEKFTLARMVTEIEAYLLACLTPSSAPSLNDSG